MSEPAVPPLTPRVAHVRPRWPWILLGVALVAAAVWLGDGPNRYRAAGEMRAGRVALLASDLPGALGHFRAAATLRPADEAIAAQYDESQLRWIEMVNRQFDKLEDGGLYAARMKLPDVEANLVEPHLGTYRNLLKGTEVIARNYATRLLADAERQREAGEFDAAEATLKQVEPFRALMPELAEKQKELSAARVAHGLAAAQAALADGQFDAAREALQGVTAWGSGQEEFRQLSTTINETEVRAVLGEATAAIKKSEFAAGRDALARAAGLKVLATEVQAAQDAFREQAAATFGMQLAVGLAKSDEAAVTAALAQGHEFAGWPSATAGPLLKPADLPAFLTALDTVGLGPAGQAKYSDRLDVPLVLYSAKKFPEAQVTPFIRENLLGWSRTMRTQSLPGLALYLDDEARKFGAPADETWRKETIAQAIESAKVTIAVAPAAPSKDAPAGLNDAATSALRKALQAKLGNWPKLVEDDPAKSVTVRFQGAYVGYYENDDDSAVTRKTVRYQSGTQEVPNRERSQLVEEHNELLQRYNQVSAALQEKENFVAQVNNGYNVSDWDRSQAANKSIEIVFDRRLLSDWRNQLRDIRARGDAMPRSLQEPVYDDEEYEIIDHVYACELVWQLAANLHGQVVDMGELSATTNFKTREVVGDSRHGVPVRAREPVPTAKLMPGLVKDIVAKAGQVDVIAEQLPEMTMQAFANFHQEKKTTPLIQAESYLDLCYAWEATGRKPAFAPKLRQYARGMLSLPPEGNAK